MSTRRLRRQCKHRKSSADNIRPIDRGMLEFKRKRLENGLVCKLYLCMDVLKVARSVHSKKQASTISILKKVCARVWRGFGELVDKRSTWSSRPGHDQQ